ncbi:hypothetical protein QJS04_geneDACA021439 [Acorus gramineus]|uniref:Retrotransposon gag domain-containing protein n=1 Tax=Acorus gramineus TaxID=55184 RepID=A0AAV9B7P1_ACOGR|nr:hypothetical protein QJS04_geneDACA021439 [Acorus gramineus]
MEVDTIFSTMLCTDRQRVSLATFMLKGSAADWWATRSVDIPEGLEQLTWAGFRRYFLEEYFPFSTRQIVMQEFEQLTQGTMSVADYSTRFTRLSRFAPALVMDEETRCRRFELGLSSAIRVHVTSQAFSRYSDLVSRAKTVERDVQGRVAALSVEEAQASGSVVRGTVQISQLPAYVLFDSEATHSFVSPAFARRTGVASAPLDAVLEVSLPVGDRILLSSVYRGCTVEIAEHEFPVELVELAMADFDAILGMDWLAASHASIDCFAKSVSFHLPGRRSFQFVGDRDVAPLGFVSSMQAWRLLQGGCEGFLAYIALEDAPLRADISQTPIVAEYPEVFPDDLPGLPPDRAIEFEINLVPGTEPVSRLG